VIAYQRGCGAFSVAIALRRYKQAKGNFGTVDLAWLHLPAGKGGAKGLLLTSVFFPDCSFMFPDEAQRDQGGVGLRCRPGFLPLRRPRPMSPVKALSASPGTLGDSRPAASDRPSLVAPEGRSLLLRLAEGTAGMSFGNAPPSRAFRPSLLSIPLDSLLPPGGDTVRNFRRKMTG